MIKTVIPWVFVVAVLCVEFNERTKSMVPADEWMSVGEVTVLPTNEGRAPILEVARVIKKNFIGEWSVTLRRLEQGGSVVACEATGAHEYRTDSRLPAEINLDWWTAPVKCDLRAGMYRVHTVWTVKAVGYPEKYIIRDSNVFEVRPAR